MRSPRRDPVDLRRHFGEPGDLAEMVAGAEHRGPQRRHLLFERHANRLGESIRRLHHHIHHKLPAGEPRLLALSVEFANRLLDALRGMPANAGAVVEHAIDGRFAQARLLGDFLDEKWVGHAAVLMGF